MTILVTGAGGHLGANLVRRLLDEGARVRTLVRPDGDGAALDGLDVERAWGDLRDLDATRAAVRGCQHVYHCAAKVSTAEGPRRLVDEIHACNVLGTRHLLRAALEHRVERVVVTGSFSAVGHVAGRPSDESDQVSPFERMLPYQRSKIAVEHECLRAVADGLDVVIATSCAIVGPHDYKPSPMGRALLDFAHGRLRAYIPGGFEFVAARDIVEGHRLVMDKGRPGQRYIFSSGYATLDELMAWYEQLTGRRRPRWRLSPALMARLAAVTSAITTRLRPDAPQRFTPGAVRLLRQGRRADITRARTELGFTPTPVRDAVAEAYTDFARRGLVPPP
jgi:3beta-hydroxysteroid-4beta-carboxylate 3-dehydrogenase (decarboxylating)